MSKVMDLTGQRSGRLVAIERSKKVGKYGEVYWTCRCDCGNKKAVRTHYFTSKHTRSCGCLAKEVQSVNIKKNHKKTVEKTIDNPKAFSSNKSTGLKNIHYIPKHGFACYRVSITRDTNKYVQSFPTLREAERAKEYVLERYKKGISNWYEKL